MSRVRVCLMVAIASAFGCAEHVREEQDIGTIDAGEEGDASGSDSSESGLPVDAFCSGDEACATGICVDLRRDGDPGCPNEMRCAPPCSAGCEGDDPDDEYECEMVDDRSGRICFHFSDWCPDAD